MHQPARRLFVALSIALSAMVGGSSVVEAHTPSFFSFTSAPRYAAIVVDASNGEVLYQRNPDSPRYPASISKVMTLYLTFEALASGRLKLNDPVVMSAHAASMSPSKLGLRPGESITVDEAIRSVTVNSCNDVAVALAERIGGSESRFATLMTLKAQQLGMSNTHYGNASGLPDPRQISTARDIAILSRAVLRDYPQYYSYFGLHTFAWNGRVMENHNHLLGRTPGVDGFKTGYIGASGFNLDASAVRGNHRLIVVVLGGSSTAARDAHVADLLDAGFEVLRQRALGQTTTVAENLREPAPIGDVVRPPTEEGSGDQAGVRIVLSSPLTSQRLVAAETPERDYAVRADHGGPPNRVGSQWSHDANANAWGVQIGAYRQRGQARAALATLKARYSDRFGDADHDVQAAGHGFYRARFSGLSAIDAKRACSALRAHHQTCVVIAPDS